MKPIVPEGGNQFAHVEESEDAYTKKRRIQRELSEQVHVESGGTGELSGPKTEDSGRVLDVETEDPSEEIEEDVDEDDEDE